MNKILIIGNCVTYSFVQMLKSASISEVDMIVCYEDFETGLDTLHSKQYDHIYTMYIFKEDNPFNTVKLKKQFPGTNVLTFPSLRYHGENPWLFDAWPVTPGPQGPYVDGRIFHSWQENIPTDSVKLNYSNCETVKTCHELCLKELDRREQLAQMDVKLSEIINELHNKSPEKKLFTAFHHPTISILRGVLKQLLKKSHISLEQEMYMEHEEIGLIVPNIHDDCNQLYDIVTSSGEAKKVDLVELVSAYYQHFDKLKTGELQLVPDEWKQVVPDQINHLQSQYDNIQNHWQLKYEEDSPDKNL